MTQRKNDGEQKSHKLGDGALWPDDGLSPTPDQSSDTDSIDAGQLADLLAAADTETTVGSDMPNPLDEPATSDLDPQLFDLPQQDATQSQASATAEESQFESSQLFQAPEEPANQDQPKPQPQNDASSQHSDADEDLDSPEAHERRIQEYIAQAKREQAERMRLAELDAELSHDAAAGVQQQPVYQRSASVRGMGEASQAEDSARPATESTPSHSRDGDQRESASGLTAVEPPSKNHDEGKAPTTTISDLSIEQQMRTDMYAIRGRVVTPRTIITDGVVVIAGDAIAWVGQASDGMNAGFADEIVAAKAPTDEGFILPGLIDIHNHGGGSELFPSAQTREQVMRAVMEHRRHGTTSMVASLVTASPLVLRERAELLADVCDEGELAGIHFEGPFVAQGHAGAQDPAHMQSPNPALTRELLVVSRGHCVAMTLAHERPYAMGPSGVVETLIEGGALPSFGHTDANAAQTRRALREVREMFLHASNPRSKQATVTHLFNGMAPPHHREPGPVYEFLADAAGGGIVCELIGDGVHLDPQVVTTTYELIGREQIVFVTDAVGTGFAPGHYCLGSTEFDVGEDLEPRTKGGNLAGGVSHLIDIVRTSHKGGIPLVDAVYSASGVPARILGMDNIGAIEVGKQADLVITDAELNPVKVIRQGKTVEG